MLAAILSSVLLVGVRIQYPAFYSDHNDWFAAASHTILALFIPILVACALDFDLQNSLNMGVIFSGKRASTAQIGITLEYLVRIVVTPRPLRYAFSIAGLVDLVAILPSWTGTATTTNLSLEWVRAVRILRFLRALKLIRHRQTAWSLWSGILPRIIPYLGIALLFKLLVLVGEGQPWWFDLSKLSTMLTVAGFSISLMLGAKLNAARGRMYKI